MELNQARDAGLHRSPAEPLHNMQWTYAPASSSFRASGRPRSQVGRSVPALGIALLGVSLACGSAARKETVVYSADFEAPPGAVYPGWASSRIEYSSRFEP